MSDMEMQAPNTGKDISRLDPEKFKHPHITAKGEKRAFVDLETISTLWINTGSLCNIECANCYIESSPTNDAYAYFPLSECERYLSEIKDMGYETKEIAFTGGEPFMNKDIIPMLESALKLGYDVLVLTNAMQPMMRPQMQKGLLALAQEYRTKLTLRVSLDHYTQKLHDVERGPASFDHAIAGMRWLNDHHIQMHVAGRSCWNETEEEARNGYKQLFLKENFSIDAFNPSETVIFPEMDEKIDVPEITTKCWDILSKEASSMMCASSRMLVLQKGKAKAEVLPCTLLVYNDDFVMGESLKSASTCSQGNIVNGTVKLNHPHCAKFCVLGGASCSA